MLAGTVAENLRIVAPEADDDQLRQALEIACAWDYVKDLPGGLDYPISGGKGLSEGQSQRLAIARALLRKAPVLLLDDVFDKLDMNRISNLLQMVASNEFGQIFITDSNKVRMSGIVDRITSDRAYFDTAGGSFRRI
jgi:ABC-type multidrug transport system fused ATPase/permease subunit